MGRRDGEGHERSGKAQGRCGTRPVAGLADLGDEKRAGTHPWRSSQPNRSVESGGKETSPGNSSLGDTHTLSGFHHALYLTGMGLSLYLSGSQTSDPKMAELERTPAIL